MTTATESDIKELKDLILSLKGDIKVIDDRLSNLENRMSHLETRISNLETDTSNLKTSFTAFETVQAEMTGKLTSVASYSQKIPDLAERVGELKNWKQIGLTLSGALIGGLVTYLAGTPHP